MKSVQYNGRQDPGGYAPLQTCLFLLFAGHPSVCIRRGTNAIR